MRPTAKIVGYSFALAPLLASAAAVFYLAFILPTPSETPNITLRGTEIILPVMYGVLQALVFLVLSPFGKDDVRKQLSIWAALSILPLILLVVFIFFVGLIYA